MSSVEKVVQTTNQLTTNYDISKFALGNNSFIRGTVTAVGADVEMVEGLVVGQIAATQLLVPCDKDATDGSQYPVGLALVTETIADGTSVEINLVNKGKVSEDKINFTDTETLATTIGAANNLRSYRNHLNDLGIELMGGVELTAVDNQ